MTLHQELKDLARYSFIGTVIGYLLVQAFLLKQISSLAWPIVDVYTWGGYRPGRPVPDPVWLLFWAQLAFGFLLSIRGKAFLLAQYVVFASAYLKLAEVDGTRMHGSAVVSSTMYSVYLFQFCATALGLISWRYRKSKALPWYPLIAFFVMQIACVWGVSQIRVSVGADLGTWILLAFLGQFIGLLFTPNRIRLLVSAEVLLGVLIAQLPRLLPTGWNSPPDTVVDGLWVAYFIQCALLAWWFLVSIACRRACHPTANDASYKTSNDKEGE